MALKTFALPGKDSRCVRYNGQVYKITTLMPAPQNRQMRDYLDEGSLQKEVEDAIRAVLAIPVGVEPTLMKTEHLVIKPERKAWDLPKKVDFLENGQVLKAPHFMFVLNLRLIEEQSSVGQLNQSSSEKPVEQQVAAATSSHVCQPEKQRRQLFCDDVTSQESGPKTSKHANTRRAPSRGAPGMGYRYTLRKRALKLSRRHIRGTGGSDRWEPYSPDAMDMADDGGVVKGDGDEETSPDSEMSKVIWGGGGGGEGGRRGGGGGDGQAQGSPILESGFSRLVQRDAMNMDESERSKPTCSHGNHPSTGDLGPSPAKPSDEEVARVGIPAHPGRELVERHVLSEQLRLQQMASSTGHPRPSSTQRDTLGPHRPQPQPQPLQAPGMIKQMIDAVVTPVKNLFSN